MRSMVYGYCRISTKQQSMERQRRNIIAAYPTARIYEEAYTGTKIERPEFEKLLRRLKAGDTVVFDSVSRMSRNAEDGWALYERLFREGVELVFLKEPYINTSTYKAAQSVSVASVGNELADIFVEAVNKAVLLVARQNIQQAFEQAQKEVDDLHQRTREGIQTARLAGKQIGQRTGAKLHSQTADRVKAVISKHHKDFGGTMNDKECIIQAQCSRNSYYKYKRELKEQQ